VARVNFYILYYSKFYLLHAIVVLRRGFGGCNSILMHIINQPLSNNQYAVKNEILFQLHCHTKNRCNVVIIAMFTPIYLMLKINWSVWSIMMGLNRKCGFCMDLFQNSISQFTILFLVEVKVFQKK
jgi:hypothetical protein